jgi:hypothetical protein
MLKLASICRARTLQATSRGDWKGHFRSMEAGRLEERRAIFGGVGDHDRTGSRDFDLKARSADRAESPATVSPKREYLKVWTETLAPRGRDLSGIREQGDRRLAQERPV